MNSEHEEILAPPQPKDERIKFRLLWVFLSVCAVALATATLPYDFSKQDPIFTKNDVYKSIESARKTTGLWPQNQTSLDLPVRAKNEQPPVTFSYISMVTKEKKETAKYDFHFRGEAWTFEVTYDPTSKPKRGMR